MTNGPVLNSRTIGLAENALRALLTKALTSTGLTYERWVALNVIADQGPIPVGQLITRLTDGLKIDQAAAATVIHDLQALAIIERAGDTLSTTVSGRALFDRLSDGFRERSQQIYGGLDVADLVVAHRVLSAITERTNALLGA